MASLACGSKQTTARMEKSIFSIIVLFNNPALSKILSTVSTGSNPEIASFRGSKPKLQNVLGLTV